MVLLWCIIIAYTNSKQESGNAFVFDTQTNSMASLARNHNVFICKNKDACKVISIGRYDNQIEECVASCNHDTRDCNGVAMFVQFTKEPTDTKMVLTFHQDVTETCQETFDQMYHIVHLFFLLRDIEKNL